MVQRGLSNGKLMQGRLRRSGRRRGHVGHARLSRDGLRHASHLRLRANDYRRARRILRLLMLLVLMLMVLVHWVAISRGHPTLLRNVAHVRAGMAVVGLGARVVRILLSVRVVGNLLLVELVVVFLLAARLTVVLLHGRRVSRQSGLRNMRWPCRQMMVHHAGG